MTVDMAHLPDDTSILAHVLLDVSVHTDREKLVELYEYQSRGYSVARVSRREYGVFWRGIRIDSTSPHTLTSAKKAVKRLRRTYALRTEIARELLTQEALAA